MSQDHYFFFYCLTALLPFVQNPFFSLFFLFEDFLKPGTGFNTIHGLSQGSGSQVGVFAPPTHLSLGNI